MTHIQNGKSIDLDLMQSNLNRSEYQEEEWIRFLEELKTQARLHPPLEEVQVRVTSDGKNENFTVGRAQDKVIELVRIWIQQQQELFALRAFQEGNGEALRAHLEQGKAVDVGQLRADRLETPYSQQRFLSLFHGLKQGGWEGNEVAQNVITLVESQLSLKEICSQPVRAQMMRDIQAMSPESIGQFCAQWMEADKK